MSDELKRLTLEQAINAIACLPDPDKGWNYPENGTKVSGLEVVIKQLYPDVSANLGGDRTFTNAWEIHLKQWDTNKSLVEVIGLLSGDLPSCYLIERVSPFTIDNPQPEESRNQKPPS